VEARWAIPGLAGMAEPRGGTAVAGDNHRRGPVAEPLTSLRRGLQPVNQPRRVSLEPGQLMVPDERAAPQVRRMGGRARRRRAPRRQLPLHRK
jgi:hypothetical protein